MSIPGNAAQKIEAARKAKGLTIMALSEELGIAKSSVQRYLKGEVAFRADTLERICKTLEIPLGDLSDEHEVSDLTGELPNLLDLAERTQKIHPMLKPIIIHECEIVEILLHVSDII